MPDECSIDNCERGVLGRGWCSAHYYRWQKYGAPTAGPPVRDWGRPQRVFGTCVAEGCERRASNTAGKGSGVYVCSKHYQRWRNYGDINAPIKGGVGSRYVNANGYVLINVGNATQILEHRLVMERHLGRKLHRDENVHHLNGVRNDNRLENLELWVTSQPPGQRVSDRVADALGILHRYAPHLLADAGEGLPLPLSA